MYNEIGNEIKISQQSLPVRIEEGKLNFKRLKREREREGKRILEIISNAFSIVIRGETIFPLSPQTHSEYLIMESGNYVCLEEC
jgi:hypothetical protein